MSSTLPSIASKSLSPRSTVKPALGVRAKTPEKYHSKDDPPPPMITKSAIKELFNLIDLNRDDFFNLKDLQDFVEKKKIQLKFTEEKLKAMYADANRANKRAINLEDLVFAIELRKSRVKDDLKTKEARYTYVARPQRDNWIELIELSVSKPKEIWDKPLIVKQGETVLAAFERDVPDEPVIYTADHNKIEQSVETVDDKELEQYTKLDNPLQAERGSLDTPWIDDKKIKLDQSTNGCMKMGFNTKKQYEYMSIQTNAPVYQPTESSFQKTANTKVSPPKVTTKLPQLSPPKPPPPKSKDFEVYHTPSAPVDAKKETAAFRLKEKGAYQNPRDYKYRPDYDPSKENKPDFTHNMPHDSLLPSKNTPSRVIERGAPDPEPPVSKEIMPPSKDFKKEFHHAIPNHLQIGSKEIHQRLPINDGEKNVAIRDFDAKKNVSKKDFETMVKTNKSPISKPI